METPNIGNGQLAQKRQEEGSWAAAAPTPSLATSRGQRPSYFVRDLDHSPGRNGLPTNAVATKRKAKKRAL
jgi:hypothetical protein